MTVGSDRKTTCMGGTLNFVCMFHGHIVGYRYFPYYYDILVYVNMCKNIIPRNSTQKRLSLLNVTLDSFLFKMVIVSHVIFLTCSTLYHEQRLGCCYPLD